MKNSPPQNDTARKNALTGLAVLSAVAFMVGLSFAAVPLYNVFCRVTGFGGTTQVAAALPEQVLDRTVTIHFESFVDPSLPWHFKPELRDIPVRLGERGLIAYRAKNEVGKPTAGTALYNVTPLKAGKYFHKIQCFCFGEQTLEPNQEVSMPVVFFVDPAMNDDPLMDDVGTITLSYTFYPAQSKTLDAALDAFYNDEEINSKEEQ